VTPFVGGNLALDFVGTLSERSSARVEHLHTPDDLAEWLREASLLDRAPPVSPTDLAEALLLRETLFAVIAREIDGRSPRLRANERALINRAASSAPPTLELSSSGQVRRTGDVGAGLSAIARDAIGLFDRHDDSVLKWCADAQCTHPFLDRSRGHRRRWCEMAGCGDRAKAAAYRSRRRSGG
jgi:predicted RNA-binding Zn ribbon-like protein